MKILIRVKPNSREPGASRISGSDDEYIVKVSSPAREGRANKEVIDILSRYFKVAKSNVRIVSGQKSKRKILEIHE